MTIIAALQMTSTQNVAANLASAAALIADAAQHQAKLIVLPEMFPIVSFDSGDKLKIKEQFGKGLIQDFLAEQANLHRVWIVAGTIPIACEEEHKIRAACIVYNDLGKAVARYDKIHLFDAVISEKEKYCESKTTAAGDEVVVIDTPFGRLGLAVCYDLRFPELFRLMANQGAEIIALPAAFVVTTGEAHWHVLLRSRAIENLCYIAASAQGGVHSLGRETYGHSLIVNPWGEIIAEKSDISPGVAYASINLEKLHQLRKYLPVLQHQKILKKPYV